MFVREVSVTINAGVQNQVVLKCGLLFRTIPGRDGSILLHPLDRIINIFSETLNQFSFVGPLKLIVFFSNWEFKCPTRRI